MQPSCLAQSVLVVIDAQHEYSTGALPLDGIDAALDRLSRLIARALDWATSAERAGDEIFNITNGDNITFPGLWPTLARHFNMPMGEPEPMRLQDIMPTKAHIWEEIAKQHDLRPVPYEKLVGQSWQFADFNFAAGKNPAPVVVSTIKLRQHGFQDCIDTEDMLIELLEQYQAEGILPR